MEEQKPTKVPEPEIPPEASQSTGMNVELLPAPRSSPTSATVPPFTNILEEDIKSLLADYMSKLRLQKEKGMKNVELLRSPPSSPTLATAADILEEDMILEMTDIDTMLALIKQYHEKLVASWNAQSTNAGEAEAASSREKEADDKAKEKGEEIVELLPAPPSSPILDEIIKKIEMTRMNMISARYAQHEAESSEEKEATKEKGKEKLTCEDFMKLIFGCIGYSDR